MLEVLVCAPLIATVAFEGKASSTRIFLPVFIKSFLCFDLLVVVV